MIQTYKYFWLFCIFWLSNLTNASQTTLCWTGSPAESERDLCKFVNQLVLHKHAQQYPGWVLKVCCAEFFIHLRSCNICHSTGGNTDRDDSFWDLSFFHCLLSSFVSSRLWSPQQQKSVKDRSEWKRNYPHVQYFCSNWAGAVLFVLWHWIYAVLHFLVSEVLFGSLQVEVANIPPDIWIALRDDTPLYALLASSYWSMHKT